MDSRTLCSYRPSCLLVIDGRKTNAAFLDEHFERRYRKSVRTRLFGGAYLQRRYELQE